VILVDELDLHLHPTWQRKVIRQLPKIFPNVQFFFTSNSPVMAVLRHLAACSLLKRVR